MIPLCGSIFLFGELLICSKKVYWSSFEERMYLSHPFCEPQRLDSKEMYFQRFSTQNIVENDLQTVLNDHIWKLKIEVDMIWHDSHGFPSTILCLNHSEKKNGTLKRHDSKAELPSGEIQLLLSRCNGQVLATACYCRCLGFWWVQFTSQFKLMILVLLLGEVSWNLLHKEIPAWRIDWKRLNEQVDGSAQNWGKSSKSWQVYQGSGDDLFASLDA